MEDIVKWFDDYHKRQREQIKEAKKHWWKNEEPKDNDFIIYNK